MIRNARDVSLDDIVARQSMIGQYHLMACATEIEKLRVAFIQAFYVYVKEGGYPGMNWTEWVKIHHGTETTAASA